MMEHSHDFHPKLPIALLSDINSPLSKFILEGSFHHIRMNLSILNILSLDASSKVDCHRGVRTTITKFVWFKLISLLNSPNISRFYLNIMFIYFSRDLKISRVIFFLDFTNLFKSHLIPCQPLIVGMSHICRKPTPHLQETDQQSTSAFSCCLLSRKCV